MFKSAVNGVNVLNMKTFIFDVPLGGDKSVMFQAPRTRPRNDARMRIGTKNIVFLYLITNTFVNAFNVKSALFGDFHRHIICPVACPP